MSDFYQNIIDDIKKEYEENPNIQALLITGSVARKEAKKGNDLDILLVTNGERISKEYRVENSLIEIGSVVLPDDLVKIDQNPMQVYMYLDARAIFDKDNSSKQLQSKAQQVLDSYKPSNEDKKAIRKWLSSVVDKIKVAQNNNDTEKAGFHVSNVLWKIVEGLYLINSMPTPASTNALRRIKTLKTLPEDFNELWNKVLLGNLEERTEANLKLIDFVLSKI